ncbi:hypothetical protein ZWY2020_017687 [Hordeum vulgare]|nr:hypothetical protein ZWY2020_017687 [Hordeum vulgare]
MENEQRPQSPRTLAPPSRRSPYAAASSPPRPTPSSSSPPTAPLPPPLLFILIALLLVFTALAFVVSGCGYREYRLGEYFTWLQRRVEDADKWARIRSCLRDGSVCQRCFTHGGEAGTRRRYSAPQRVAVGPRDGRTEPCCSVQGA